MTSRYAIRYTTWTSEFVKGVGIVRGTETRISPCNDLEHAESELRAAKQIQAAHNIPQDAEIVHLDEDGRVIETPPSALHIEAAASTRYTLTDALNVPANTRFFAALANLPAA